MDVAMMQCIEETGICMAMVGLLVALPNTQLTRRLRKEGRLLSFSGLLADEAKEGAATMEQSVVEVVDQTLAGLNFITTRPRAEILQEYCNVIRSVYEPKSYMDRALRVAASLRPMSKRLP